MLFTCGVLIDRSALGILGACMTTSFSGEGGRLMILSNTMLETKKYIYASSSKLRGNVLFSRSLLRAGKKEKKNTPEALFVMPNVPSGLCIILSDPLV